MADEAPSGKPVVALVETVLGSSASDDGTSVRVGFKLAGDVQADLILPVDRAVELMRATGSALGEAGRRQLDDPNLRYRYPAQSWALAEMADGRSLSLSLGLPDGAEFSFQIDRSEAHQLMEGLANVLKVPGSTPVPKSPIH